MLVLTGLAVTGCGAGNPLDPPAATVDGVKIDEKTLQADIEAQEDASADQPPAADGSVFDITGQGEGTYKADAVAFMLADRVRAALVNRLIRRDKLEVTPEMQDSARQQLCGGVDQQTGQPADCATFEAYPQEYQDFQVELVSEQLALAEKYGPELQAGLQDDYDQLVADEDESLLESCFDANGFQTEQEAATAAEALPETPFEELSEGYQELGCLSFAERSELPAELASIEDGGVSAPLADPSGVFVLARRTDGVQPFEQYARSRIQGGAALTDQILKAESGDVSVQVDSKYGRWDADQFRVVEHERPEGVEPPDAVTPAG